VLQAATKAARARPERQAIAANVPLRPEDDADGIPYATLLTLPSNGVVVVASFTRARENRDRSASSAGGKLPLRLRDATPRGGYDTQLRPTNPLGQYRLRVEVNGYGVDVDVYFGTRRPSSAAITAAQRQLDRLVVRSVGTSNPVEERALPMRPAETPRGAVAGQATGARPRASHSPSWSSAERARPGSESRPVALSRSPSRAYPAAPQVTLEVDRIVVPEKSAAPCFATTLSQTFVS
jgi:hypothetical protein